MDWTQVLTIVGSNIALFLWAVRQSRNDYLHMDKKLDSFRELIHEIHLEMKDFHGRLCNIEANRNK